MSEILSGKKNQIVWLDLMKAFALFWIFINHMAEQLFGFPLIANPYLGWPPLAERFAQLAPLQGYGVWTILVNSLRYFGWFGDQGVQLFLIASGFGLTWGLLQRQQMILSPLWKFYLRRAERIFPLWWGAHLVFAAAWLVIGWGISLTEPSFFLSLIGLRVTPGLFYYFSPAWWYIGLLIQLYLIYPLLWQGLLRLGPTRMLLISCTIAFLVRGIGLYIFTDYLDIWQRGGLFITRLPEFVFGISLAAWLFESPVKTDRFLRSPLTVIFAVMAYGIGTVLALTLPGMTFAPFLLGASAFVILYTILVRFAQKGSARIVQPTVWMGQHSYSLYLMHHPWILVLVPLGLGSPLRIILGVVAASILTLTSAIFLEQGVAVVIRWLNYQIKARGFLHTVIRLVVLVIVFVGLLVSGELLVQRFDPQEVFGWGERPSLEADDVLGWHLIPDQSTHLRWGSYDYVIKANSLGFPGRTYPSLKDPNKLRILVTGDAFTSAEGVDSNDAWPSLLEKDLEQKIGKPVEVLNFAITGYGPNQYAAVIEKYAPVYQPDLIVVETFVNDFQDALLSNTDFQQSIGFGSPAQNGLYTTLRLEHLRRFMRLHVVEPLGELVRGKPSAQGYFLGNFLALERGHPEFEETGQQKVAEQLVKMKSISDQMGTRLLVMMVPAPVQVCSSEQLAYYPQNVDIVDTVRYDVDLPQRLMSQITSSLDLPFYDLRKVMQTAPDGCPYQSHNMHWTKAGHQIVAAYLTDVLADFLQKP